MLSLKESPNGAEKERIRRRQQRNETYLNANYPELKTKYSGEHIAVLDAEIIDRDKDPEEMLLRLQRQFNPESEEYKSIAVWYIAGITGMRMVTNPQ